MKRYLIFESDRYDLCGILDNYIGSVSKADDVIRFTSQRDFKYEGDTIIEVIDTEDNRGVRLHVLNIGPHGGGGELGEYYLPDFNEWKWMPLRV